MTSQRFLFHEGSKSSNLDIYPQKTGLTLKNWVFISRIILSDPKLTSPVNFSDFQAEENFLDVSMRKEQQQPPWLINLANFVSQK